MQNRRLFRYTRHWLLLTIAAVMLFAALPTAASAASADAFLNSGSVESLSGGTYVYAELMQRSSDGAVYLNVFVYDYAADGLCAHAAVGWLHENNSREPIYEYGMWHCGYGTGEWFTTPVRNWQDYDAVWLVAFEDGNRGWNEGPYLWDWFD